MFETSISLVMMQRIISVIGLEYFRIQKYTEYKVKGNKHNRHIYNQYLRIYFIRSFSIKVRDIEIFDEINQHLKIALQNVRSFLQATTEAAKKASTETTEESTSAEKSETETEPQPAETTPAPPLRGLDALFARRRAAGGIGARPARPARGARYPK